MTANFTVRHLLHAHSVTIAALSPSDNRDIRAREEKKKRHVDARQRRQQADLISFFPPPTYYLRTRICYVGVIRKITAVVSRLSHGTARIIISLRSCARKTNSADFDAI